MACNSFYQPFKKTILSMFGQIFLYARRLQRIDIEWRIGYDQIIFSIRMTSEKIFKANRKQCKTISKRRILKIAPGSYSRAFINLNSVNPGIGKTLGQHQGNYAGTSAYI